MPDITAQRDQINIRIKQNSTSGIPLCWASEPESEILMVMRSFGPLDMSSVTESGLRNHSESAVWGLPLLNGSGSEGRGSECCAKIL